MLADVDLASNKPAGGMTAAARTEDNGHAQSLVLCSVLDLIPLSGSNRIIIVGLCFSNRLKTY